MLPVHFRKAAKWTHVVGGVVFFRYSIELYILIIPFVSETSVEGERLVRPVYAHSWLGVFPNSLLEEVSFSL